METRDRGWMEEGRECQCGRYRSGRIVSGAFFYRWRQQFPQERDQGGERERGTVERKRVREGEDRIESKEEVPGRERRVDVRARLTKSNLIKISVLTL